MQVGSLRLEVSNLEILFRSEKKAGPEEAFQTLWQMEFGHGTR